MNKNLVRIVVLSIIIIPLAFMWWITNQSQLYQGEHGPALREELSFTTSSPYILAGNEKIEVFTISPNINGYMYSVGFNDGDIIISETITQFYKLLYKSKGEKISVNVVDGGDGLPIERRKIRKIEFKVPLRE